METIFTLLDLLQAMMLGKECRIIVTPGNVYEENKWVGVSSLRDLFVIEVIYVEDKERHIVWCNGFG